MPTAEEITQLINDKALEIRELKAAGTGGDALKPVVASLLALKEQFKEVTGKPFDPPAAKPKKAADKPADTAAAASVPEGPSKNELAKLAKKAAKNAAKAAAKAGGVPASTPAGITQQEVAQANGTAARDQVCYSAAALPALATAACSLTGCKLHFEHTAAEALPCLTLTSGNSITGDHAIARYIVRSSTAAAQLLGGADAVASSQVDQWLDACLSHTAQELSAALDSYLQSRTYLAGHSLTLADVAVYAKLGSSSSSSSSSSSAATRWQAMMAELPEVSTALRLVKALSGLAARPAAAASSAKTAAVKAGKKGSSDSPAAASEEVTGSLPPLEGAVEGAVMTRFPPEPSGYLHIGHVKACLLNEYYARRYKGKLLIRFDDTNPSKEKGEFEDAILTDLATLGVQGDLVSHTSDFFPQLRALAEKAVAEGWAFMDNTPQEVMQAERMERKNSAKRDSPIAENQRLFELMCKGDPEGAAWCLRAKIDMSSVNGTMRDPVLYRMNLTPHHKTGTKYKAYPTYDFACPVVDSLEGVTHALRTTEYNDRDEQYYWLQDKLGLRRTLIHSFARMNFVRTVLSKRKLAWFVQENKVDGWFDPRFPTVQGVMRRGVSVTALRSFILAQGASRRITTMEWDKFWSSNKAQYEPTAPRYMGVFAEGAVVLTLTDVEDPPSGGASAISVPLHPKDPAMGQRPMRIGPRVLLEGSDAAECKEGENITLMRWGVVTVTAVQKDPSTGAVTGVTGVRAPTADFKGTRKLNWLAQCDDLVPAVLVEFDYLISKDKLEETDELQEHLTPVTRAESAALVDPCMRGLRAGDVVQLERRGFFRVDAAYGAGGESTNGGDAPLVLFMIPDGKTSAMSTLTTSLKHV